MIGILVLSHGNLSQGIVESGKMIVGTNEKVDYLGLYEGNTLMSSTIERLKRFKKWMMEKVCWYFQTSTGRVPSRRRLIV